MKEDITIQQITSEKVITDRQEIIDLLKENLQVNIPEMKNIEIYVLEKLDQLVEFLKEKKAFVLGAYYQKTLIGFVWGYKMEGNIIHISHLVVNRFFRGKGIGSNLLNAFEKNFGANMNISIIASTVNTKAIDFYIKHGYEEKRVYLEKKAK
jgi:ribosomal protein S18 acetylase RimI-like enzyme